jgi:hypothetical protein
MQGGEERNTAGPPVVDTAKSGKIDSSPSLNKSLIREDVFFKQVQHLLIRAK